MFMNFFKKINKLNKSFSSWTKLIIVFGMILTYIILTKSKTQENFKIKA